MQLFWQEWQHVYLKDEQEEEVGISEPLELLKKIKWQEGEDVVFGGLDGIVLKLKKSTEESYMTDVSLTKITVI